jgi:hypothetical protein
MDWTKCVDRAIVTWPAQVLDPHATKDLRVEMLQ